MPVVAINGVNALYRSTLLIFGLTGVSLKAVAVSSFDSHIAHCEIVSPI